MKHLRSDMAERGLLVNEIPAHLGVNPDPIYKWTIRTSMSAHKVGQHWKILVKGNNGWGKIDDGLRETNPYMKS